MFERYDDAARRGLFFARYEATRLGGGTIEAEHLLLGLTREPLGHFTRMLFLSLPLADMRKELESNRTSEKIGSSIEIPFSAAAKRILNYASDEADALRHHHVGTEHLLLGLIRETESLPAAILARHGVRLDETRELVRELFMNESPVPKSMVQESFDALIKLTLQLQISVRNNKVANGQVNGLLLGLKLLKSLVTQR